MREVVVVPPESAKRAGRVRKVQFGASGAELAAWVEPQNPFAWRVPDNHERIIRFDLSRGACAQLSLNEWNDALLNGSPILSPDFRWLSATGGENDYESPQVALFADLSRPNLEMPCAKFYGPMGIAFLPDSANLLVLHRKPHPTEFGTVCVSLLSLTQFGQPQRFVRRPDPYTGQPRQEPVWKRVTWKTQLKNPGWLLPQCYALSANGQFLVVSDEKNDLHFVDLTRKRASSWGPAEGHARADRDTHKIAIDDAGERVYRLANKKLLARNATGGNAWSTKPALGSVTDFALSPDQRTVCAVFDSGHARTFDAHSGAIRKELRWGKKALYSVCFAPDGLTCAAGSTAGRVVLWDVDG